MNKETKDHIFYWINETIKDLNRNRELFVWNELYDGNEIDDNIINEMIEQTIKIQAYLEKIRGGDYE